MATNPLKVMFETAFSAMGGEQVTVDFDAAEKIMHSLGEISAGIEMAAAQIRGPVSEAKPVWTGEAAEQFYADTEQLLSETLEISRRVSQNRQQMNNALMILKNAESKVENDVSSLDSGSIFTNV